MLSTFWSTGARRSQRKTLNTGFLLSDNYFFGSNHSRRHSNVLIIGSWLLACVEQTLRTSLASARFFSVHVSYSMPQLHNWWKVCRPQPHPTPSILALRLSFNVYSSSVDEVVRILRECLRGVHSVSKQATLLQVIHHKRTCYSVHLTWIRARLPTRIRKVHFTFFDQFIELFFCFCYKWWSSS